MHTKQPSSHTGLLEKVTQQERKPAPTSSQPQTPTAQGQNRALVLHVFFFAGLPFQTGLC